MHRGSDGGHTFWYFTGEDSSGSRGPDTDRRQNPIYYTARFSDDFKYVNKFEFNWVYGTETLGHIGADGADLEIKNSYIEFNTWK